MVGKVEARGRSGEKGAARVLKSLYQGVRLLPACLFSPFTITERKHNLTRKCQSISSTVFNLIGAVWSISVLYRKIQR